MSKRVLVTGLGAITPLGNSVKESWLKLTLLNTSSDKNAGMNSNGITPITQLPEYKNIYEQFAPLHYPESLAVGKINYDTVAKKLISENIVESSSQLQKLNKATALLLGSVHEALGDAHLTAQSLSEGNSNVGTAIGTGIASIHDTYDSVMTFALSVNQEKDFNTNSSTAPRKKRREKLSPYLIPKILANIPSAHVHMKYQFQGPMIPLSSACATGTQSIGEAYLKMLRTGSKSTQNVDVMVVGATEASVHPMALAGFHRAKSLSTTGTSKPFDTNRNGFVLGEGCGILVLEQHEHWKSRNVDGKCAPVYAEVCGYGSSTDAYHLTAPHPEGKGAFRAMQECVPQELLEKENDAKTVLVNCHATSTKLGDVAEIKAITKLFGPLNHKVYLTSNKGHMGHLLGAAGAVESIFSCKSLQTHVIPPTLNLENVDEEIAKLLKPFEGKIQIVDTKMVEGVDIDYCIKNSFGFGGVNTSVCFKKFVR
ncbi:hypothetical protein ACO0RG_004110 [Hanseniaspora osmophila]